MTPETLIVQILAGGLLGVLGQGLRSIAGMKKVHDMVSASGQAFSDVFETSKLLTSLMIGFVAGALGLLTASWSATDFTLDKSTIMTLIAAGYAGTDFLDAFISKTLPAPGSADSRQGPSRQPPAVG